MVECDTRYSFVNMELQCVHTFSQNCVVLFVFLPLRNIQHTSCLCGCMEKGAWWFNMFVSENKNSRQVEWKLMFCNKAVDQATAHQHLKTCRRYATCWRKIICMIIIMELWLLRQLPDSKKWSFSNRGHTFCMFSNVDVLLQNINFYSSRLEFLFPITNMSNHHAPFSIHPHQQLVYFQCCIFLSCKKTNNSRQFWLNVCTH